MSIDLCTGTYQPHMKADLNKRDQEELWTDKLVSSSKVLTTRWMRQFAHTWRHFASWVPWVRFIQGTKHTWFAGSYTLFNTQEIAVMSGIAAAERLGAEYPFPDDPLAVVQFDMFMGVTHGAKRRPPSGRPWSSSLIASWASPTGPSDDRVVDLLAVIQFDIFMGVTHGAKRWTLTVVQFDRFMDVTHRTKRLSPSGRPV
eukprot:gene16264-22443_t